MTEIAGPPLDGGQSSATVSETAEQTAASRAAWLGGGAAAGFSAGVSDPRRWRVLGVLALVQFMLVLDTTVVNVALPSIQRDLHFSAGGLAWVVNGYTLMAGGFLIFGGRIADLLGRRRLFMAGLALFAAASATSGFAQDSTMLVVSRFGQGLGEAIAGPAALSLAVLMFADPKERARAVGLWGGLAGLGGTTGVLLSGVITSELSWRWVFLINVPIAAAVLLVAPYLVPESRSRIQGRVDVVGALLITAGLTLIVDGLLSAANRAWGSSAVVIPLVIGVILVLAFVGSQRVITDPLVPLRFFRNRTRVMANIGTVCFTASFISMFYVLTLYMQEIGHYSPLKTGLAYLPFGGALLVGIGLSTQVMPRIGVRVGLALAFAISGAGYLLLGQISVHVGYVGHLMPGLLLVAFGNGFGLPGLQNAALYQIDGTDAGLASGVQNTFLQVGGSLGLSVLVTLGLHHATARIAQGTLVAAGFTSGYSLALRIAGALSLAVAIIVPIAFERVDFIPPAQQAVDLATGEVYR